jgi:hypothetical protein
MRSRFDEMVASYDDEMSDWGDVVTRSSRFSRTPPSHTRPRRPWMLRRAFVAIAAAAAAAVALAAPWNASHGPLDDLALAAIGSAPVIHVIGEFPTGADVVNFSTGATHPLMQRQEVWYSAATGLLHTRTYSDSTLVDDTLATPQGTFTPQGIVYDCAWIAAHPAAATKAHVSCNASGQNGTTPRQIPRPTPTLDPTLSGFVDNYQQALSSGAAHADGSGQLGGRSVDWLIFNTTDNGRERVALDATSHKPVLVTNDHGGSLQIVSVETTAYDASDFNRPSASEVATPPSRAESNDVQALGLDSADIAKALTNAVWAGATVNGVSLVRAEEQSLEATYANNTLPAQRGTGVELAYGTLGADNGFNRSKPYIKINMAPTASLAMAYMWHATVEPSAGSMLLWTSGPSTAYRAGGKTVTEPGLSFGQLVINGLHVTIQSSSRDLLLAAAQTLRAAHS